MDPLMIKTKKFPVPYRGPNSSSDLKDFTDNVYRDLNIVADEITKLNQTVEYMNTVQFISDEINRNNVQGLLADKDQEQAFLLLAGYPGFDESDYFFNLYDSQYVLFEGAAEKHGYYVQNQGLAKPPRNTVANIFYYRDSLKDYKVISRNPAVVFNTEPAGSDFFLKDSDTINMFNGDNNLYWVRQYSYALDNDISSVTLDFTVTLPAGLGQDPNYLIIDPYPSLGLAINSISSNVGAISSVVLENTGQIAMELPSGVTELTFNITQPSFRIQNGRKVFLLGFREIDAQKIGWDESITALSPTPTTDNHIILEVPLNKEFGILEEIQFDAEVQKVIIKGKLVGVLDGTPLTIDRAQLNQAQLINSAHAFSGNVDSLYIEVYINADPAENPNRINTLTTDTIKNISIRMK